MAGEELKDSAPNVAVIRARDLGWTILRYPHLTDGPLAGNYRADYGPSASSGVAWLLGLLSALLVGAAAGVAVHKTLGRWVS